MERLKKPLIPASVAALLIMGVFAFSCKFSFADDKRPDRGSIAFGSTKPAPKFDSFRTVFADIANEVIPTVVSVIPTKIDTVVYYNNPFYRFFDSPFEFFGDPRQQQQQQPEMRKEERRQSGIGSGVIVSKDGYILTNFHVVDGADEIRIQLSDEREFGATVVGSDSLADVAVIKVEGDVHDLPVARLGDSDKLRPGDWCLAVGNPLALSSTVTVGIVSALNRGNVGGDPRRYQNFIQTDAAINPGNSGGALVNIDGDLVGINTMIWTRTGGSMGIGFAIPINMAKWIMESLIYEGEVKRGWLGVGIKDLDEDMRAHLGLFTKQGVLIDEVYKGQPAGKAGIKIGDVILSIDGVRTENANKLRNTVAGIRPGSKVPVVLMRKGEKKTVEVALALRDDETIGKLSSSGEGTEGEAGGAEADLAEALGVKVGDLSADIREELRIDKKTKGVVVLDVNPTSVAARKGLRRGDVITMVQVKQGDLTPVAGVKEFEKLVKQAKKEDSVMLRVERGGRSFLVAFKLG